MSATTINDVITNEYTRLSQKKLEADTAVSAQRRAILLNESYKKRFTKYTQIIMVITFALLVYLGISSINKSTSFIPEWIIDVFAGLFFAGTAIYCILIAQDIWTRNVTNFDELDLPPYIPLTSKDAMTTLDENDKKSVSLSNMESTVKSEPSPIYGPIPTHHDNQITGVGLKDAFVLLTK